MKKITFFLSCMLLTLGVTNAWAAYEKATSIAVGDVVVLVNEDASKELNGFSTSNTVYGLGEAYTTAPAGLYKLTVEEGASAGTVAFKNGSTYLNWSSGNSLTASDTKTENSSWTVTFEEGNAIILNVADNARKLQWNASSPRFACYTSVQTAVQLYKEVESTGGEDPVDPEPEPEPDPETPEGAITCAEAVEVCQATGTTSTTDTYTIHGYVTSIKTAYSSTHGNISFWMADTKDGGEVLQCYRVVPVKDGEENVKVGDKVEVIGTLVNYNGNTPEVNAGGTYTILEVAAGGETPDPEEPENPEDAPTYDFTNINGFTTWGSSYSKHEVTYSDAVVTFASANKNGQTITDQPVTKGGDVTLVMTDGSNLSSVKWVCKQWSDKAQTITLHYSVDGGYSYESTGITSDNFTISSDELPAGTNAVKITFSSSSNQVGITSCTIGKIDASDIVVTTVAKPTFSLLPGTYEGAQEIEILCATESATIYYTIDGTDPSVTSDVYSAPITISGTTTVRAYAVKDGLTDSEVAEAIYTIIAPADFVLDFTNNDDWGFPTEKTVTEESFTSGDYTVSVVGSEGQGYKYDANTLMVGKNGSYLVLPVFNKPIEKIVTVGVATGSGSVTFNVYIGENAVSTEVKSCKVDQTFLIAEDSQVANVAHVIKVTNDNNVRFSQIKFYFGEGNDPTTALDNIAVEGKAVKAIVNGQLIIIKNGVQYNAQGQVIK